MSFSSSLNSSTFSVGGIQFLDGSRITSATTPLKAIAIQNTDTSIVLTDLTTVIFASPAENDCEITLPLPSDTLKIPNGFTITLANLWFYGSRKILTVAPNTDQKLIYNNSITNSPLIINETIMTYTFTYFYISSFYNGWIVGSTSSAIV
jgi:hypothetical protein